MSAKKSATSPPHIKTAAKAIVKPIPKWLITLAIISTILVAIVFSLKSLTEPDTWWQLRTGQWIIQNGKVPTHDIFSYTMQGSSWINVKWLSEVILYFFQLIGGPEFVLILQVIIILMIIYFIKKIYNSIYEIIYAKKTSTVSPSLLLVILVTLICIGFRLNGRPEMFSHLFTITYILILLKNRLRKTNLLYLLIPLQTLWANLHEGYGTGLVILFIFSITSYAEFIFQKTIQKKEAHFDWRLSLVLLCSILAVAIHPYGITMITHPIEIYRQLNINKYTTELVSFTYSKYWTLQAYLNIILFAASIPCLFLNYKKDKESRFTQLTKYFGWGYPALLLAFFILSLTANRNIPFSAISCCPILAIGLGHLISNYVKRKKQPVNAEFNINRRLYVLSIAFSIFLYVSVTTNKFYTWTNSISYYGLQVDALNNPSGAADFVKQNKITGRCFSDYLTSSYLMWTLRPDFKTFIDLRDLDVFPVSFFEKFSNIISDPNEFQKSDSIYHYDYLILYRSQFQTLHNYLLRSKDYELVFVDPVAAVYLKREDRFTDLIAEYGFQNGKNDIFSVTQPVKPNSFSTIISSLFNPFYSPRDYSDVDFNLEASKFYFNCDYPNLAYVHIQKSLQTDPGNVFVQDMAGNIALAYLQQIKGDEAKQYFELAQQSFQKANSINSKDEQSLMGLGECAVVSGNNNDAISYFQKCIDMNPKNIDCWANLADLYEDLSNNDKSNATQWLQKRLECMKKMNSINPNNPLIIVELGYAYYKVGDCNAAVNYVDQVKNFKHFSKGHQADLEEVLQHCK